MKPARILVLALVVLTLGFWWLSRETQETHAHNELNIHCAAGLRLPVEEIAASFEREFGVKIHLNYGGSGELLGKISLVGGDLYIPADSFYTDEAGRKDLVSEATPFAKLTAVIMVKKGNPRNIGQLHDLTKPEVRVTVAARSAAIGKISHEVLEGTGVLERVQEGGFTTTTTVNAVANAVKLGSADAGVVWDSFIPQYPEHDFIHVPEFDAKAKTAAIAILKSNRNSTLSHQFARYLSSSTTGKETLRKYGFKVIGSTRNEKAAR